MTAGTVVRVALATGNRGKVEEVMSILADAGVEVVPADPAWEAPEETGETYLENALLKARSHAKQCGVPTLADDSGIEVDALGGRPAVQSARYAGPGATDAERVSKLLEELLGIPLERRTARFRCVAVLVLPSGIEFVSEGTVEGRIANAPRGKGGFGYDPVFVPVGSDRTMAELNSEEKHRISHRGNAFRGLIPALHRLAP